VSKVALSLGVLLLMVHLGSVAQVRDPTEPARFQLGSVEGFALESTRFRLSAILISPSRKVAIINGVTLKEGNKVLDATVLSIEPGIVRLQQAKKGDIVLELFNLRVKQKSSREKS